MPGITIALEPGRNPRDVDAGFKRSQSPMLHFKDYTAYRNPDIEGLALGHVAYPEYPISYIHDKNFVIAIEGKIYNKTTRIVVKELTDIAEKVILTGECGSNLVSAWIEKSDGEYLVVISDLAGKHLIAFSDVFGALPIYFYTDPNLLLLAREIKFITNYRGVAVLDPIACGQCIWVGYSLGERTLTKDVLRAPGGMYLESWSEENRVNTIVKSIYTFNFDNKDASKDRLEDYIDSTIDLFNQATLDRSNDEMTANKVLGLSGGMDSRTVAASLHRQNASFYAAVMDIERGQYQFDVPLAKEISEILGIDLTIVKIPSSDLDYMRCLVKLKDGQNGAWAVFMLHFLQFIVEKWGRNAVYLSGDGGDKLMVDLRPRNRIQSFKQLLWSISHFNAETSPMNIAERIMQLHSKTLEEVLADILSSYPEKRLEQKAVHYTIYEKGRKFLFEGQDRNRYFLWHTAPFYSMPLFNIGMSIPDKYKHNKEYYRKFLLRLEPEMFAVKYGNIGVAPSSPLFTLKQDLMNFAFGLPEGSRELIRFLVKGPRKPFQASGEMYEILAPAFHDNRFMSGDALRKYLPRMDEVDFKKILAIMLLRETLEE